MSSLIENDKLYLAPTYKRFNVEIERGEGSILYDYQGKSYIDMGSGIGVSVFGFNDKAWKDAVISQLDKVQHTSNLYYTKPCVDLAKVLCDRTGFKKVFFANSGAEANECAIKVARKYAEDKGVTDGIIVTLKNSFHGRTITTLSATGQEVFHKSFKPLTDGFCHVSANCLDEVVELSSKVNVIAVMIECVQGEGGVNALDKEYVVNLSKLSKEKDFLLIVDEVQTGNGRTGELYAYQNFGIMPDVITTAKGLGGGLPIGACLIGKKVENVLSYGDHGSTFGANPVACSGALSIINRLDDNFLNSVKEKSKFIFDQLNGAKGVISVSGMGLMIGVETTKPAIEVVNKCIEKGVLFLTAKNKVRLLPALNISKEDLQTAVNVLKEVLAE